jgi:hypothetical protein
MAQVRAITTGKEEISVNTIRRVAKENLRLVRPMLDALKSGNARKIAEFEDICTADIDFTGFVSKERQPIDFDLRVRAIQKQQNEKENQVVMSTKEQVISKLVDLGMDLKKAQSALDKIIGDRTDYEVNDTVIQCIQMLNKPIKTTRQVKAKNKIELKPDDIRNIVETGRKGNKSAYEALKDKGYIKSFEDDFFSVG